VVGADAPPRGTTAYLSRDPASEPILMGRIREEDNPWATW
jgi:hypothetical protein